MSPSERRDEVRKWDERPTREVEGLIVETLTKIKPTDLLRLVNQGARRNGN